MRIVEAVGQGEVELEDGAQFGRVDRFGDKILERVFGCPGQLMRIGTGAHP